MSRTISPSEKVHRIDLGKQLICTFGDIAEGHHVVFIPAKVNGNITLSVRSSCGGTEKTHSFSRLNSGEEYSRKVYEGGFVVHTISFTLGDIKATALYLKGIISDEQKYSDFTTCVTIATI